MGVYHQRVRSWIYLCIMIMLSVTLNVQNIQYLLIYLMHVINDLNTHYYLEHCQCKEDHQCNPSLPTKKGMKHGRNCYCNQCVSPETPSTQLVTLLISTPFHTTYNDIHYLHSCECRLKPSQFTLSLGAITYAAWLVILMYMCKMYIL